ncbi:MAG: RecX family transcriptional regulator [Lachnospiraceae bacterium]|nr:RecX family transcriptional regulator [Lachnospiraceae bacterium]
MRITRIEQIQGGRGRARIFLDDAFAFVLYKKECKEYGITEGGELSGEAYASIVEELLPKRARLRAMHLLEKRPYTEKGLRDKLSDGEYPEETVSSAIDYVRSYGYIDDLRYARDHIAYHLQDRNRARLERDLMTKGVGRDVIAQAFREVLAEEGYGDAQDARSLEADMIRKELRKKHFDGEQASYEERMKILAQLSRKGYSAEALREALGSPHSSSS